MAAVPGESDRWPAAPRSGAAGPPARLRPVPDHDPGTGPLGQAAPWLTGQPPAGFGAGSAAEYGTGPPSEETGSLLLPRAAAEPAAEPPFEPGPESAPEPGPRPAPEPGPQPAAAAEPGPAPAFDAVPMPDLSTALTAEPLAGPEPETAPWAEPETEAGLVPRAEPEPDAALVPWAELGPVRQPGPGQETALVPRRAGEVPQAAELSGPVEMTERAVIGDKLRAPGVWCELTPCISHHIDPAALGEADVRERAVAAGWRYDALGRLTCPACQQTDPRFRGTQAVMRWERDTAITMAALMVAGFHESQRGMTTLADQTAVIPVFPDAVIPPGASQDPGHSIRDA